MRTRPQRLGTHKGWYTVGDIGYLDEDGYLYLTDRRNHMIISGGVNIYPQEAENMLVSHPKVMDAAVFGIPDDEMGQRVQGRRADRRSGPTPPTPSPRNCRDGCGIGWRTTSVRVRSPSRPNLPRTDTGKLYKQELDREVLDSGRLSPMGPYVVDLGGPCRYEPPLGVVVAVGDPPDANGAEYWLQPSKFHPRRTGHPDGRTVTVPSVADAMNGLSSIYSRTSGAVAASCGSVRRRAACGRRSTPRAFSGCDRRVARVLDAAVRSRVRPLARRARTGDCARARRSGSGFERDRGRAGGEVQPSNVVTTRSRLTPARLCSTCSTSHCSIHRSHGVGALAATAHSFCSGGDLAEFGTFVRSRDRHTWRAPATALRSPSTHSPPGWALRAGPRCTGRCSAAGWRWPRSAGT